MVIGVEVIVIVTTEVVVTVGVEAVTVAVVTVVVVGHELVGIAVLGLPGPGAGRNGTAELLILKLTARFPAGEIGSLSEAPGRES